MSAGNNYENAHLDAAFGDNRASMFPAIVYVALYTAAPSDAGGGTEVAVGAYARVGVANTTANWPAAVGGQKKNANPIQFPTATADWGTITHFSLMDAVTAGNVIHWGPLTAPATILTTQTPIFGVNQLIITAD